MLNRIIKFSLNNKLLVLLAVVLVTVGGIYSAKKIEVDVFPDLTMPTVDDKIFDFNAGTWFDLFVG